MAKSIIPIFCKSDKLGLKSNISPSSDISGDVVVAMDADA